MRRLITSLLVLIFLSAGFFVTGWLLPQHAAAQIPVVPMIGYGQTIAGEVTAAAGNEHHFTGCAGEGVSISVTANDFSPRIELYDGDEANPMASATAQSGASSQTVILAGVALPASGRYTIVVNGRNRTDRGGYSLTMQGVGADGSAFEDGPTAFNLMMDQAVRGTLRAGRSIEWNFRGCEGDEIEAQLAGNDFLPKLTLFDSSASAPLATSVGDEATDDATDEATDEDNLQVTNHEGFTVTLRYALPSTGSYLLVAAGANRGEFGNYSLGLYRDANLEGQATPTATSATAPTAESTATPGPTRTGGPQVRRGGAATPAAPNQAPARTPTTPQITPQTTPTATSTPIAAATPTATAISTVAPTATPAIDFIALDIFCTVIADRLNLRPGPGTAFNPPLTTLDAGALLGVVGRNADASWLQITVLDVDLNPEFTGWVSADFVFCIGELDDMPVVE